MAYKATRPNGATLPVIFPRLVTEIPLNGEDFKSFGEVIVRFPEFPIEATCFTAGSQEAIKWQNYGAGNTIDIEEYENETWKFENGSTIFLEHTTDTVNTHRIHFYAPDKTEISSISVRRNVLSWLYSVIENSPEDGSATAVYDVGGTEPIRFRTNFPSSIHQRFATFFEGLEPIVSGDPYDDAGNTESGGGEGDFDNSGDLISAPELPSISTSTGFISIYNPTLDQLKNLSEYMWSDLFDVSTLKKLFANPMDAIIGLSILPVKIPTAILTTDVKVGNISTGIQMWPVTSQYVTLDCGTLNVNEYWGAYLDYSPYTKAEIYLPYIGTHTLDIDDIMGKAVHLIYHIDILSGACCAYILCNDTVIYSFLGQCSTAVPVTGNDWTNVINGALTIATSIGSMVATGGATAPMGISQIASTAVNSLKPTVEKSGSMSGSGGLLAVQTPYLILTRPRQAVPRDQNSFTGYPSFITENLVDLTGYTEIENIHLENIPATENELNEIETLLKNGVIF